MVWLTLRSRTAKEQNRTEQNISSAVVGSQFVVVDGWSVALVSLVVDSRLTATDHVSALRSALAVIDLGSCASRCPSADRLSSSGMSIKTDETFISCRRDCCTSP